MAEGFAVVEGVGEFSNELYLATVEAEIGRELKHEKTRVKREAGA